jgi:hypothetical protein
LWRFGHDGQYTNTARNALGRIWIENTERFHLLATEFFTQQEDDLNFPSREFLLLCGVNNTDLSRPVSSQNSGANELLIISVRRNDKSSLPKTDRQLFKVIQTY